MEEDEANAVATLLAGTRGGSSSPQSKASPKGGGASKRWRITPKALELLECVYAQEACPSTATRDVLALQLGATPRQVQVWFQNKRQRRAGKAKREQEAANGLTSSGVQDSHYPTQTSPLPSVPETVSTAALFDLPTLAPGAAPPPASAPTDPQQNHQQPSLSVYVPPSPEGAVAAQSSGAHATTGGAPSAAGAATGAPGVAPPRAARGNSLSDLASVAECVDSLEHLTGGLTRVNSLKDLVALSRAGSSLRQVDLANLSKVVSLSDLAGISGNLGSQQQVA